jgi:hypothetical protein
MATAWASSVAPGQHVPVGVLYHVPGLLYKTHTCTCPPSAVTTTLPPWQKRRNPPRRHQPVLQRSRQAPLAAHSYRMEASEDVLPIACSGADVNLREAQPHAKRGVAKNLGFHQLSHKNSNQQDRKIARESYRDENMTTRKGTIALQTGCALDSFVGCN